MVDDQDKQRREEEALKLYFEVLKHVATLDVATAVVLLTVYREAAVEIRVLVVALLAFCVSLIASFFGMITITNMVNHLDTRQDWRGGKFLKVASVLSAPLYLAGLVAFALFALKIVT